MPEPEFTDGPHVDRHRDGSIRAVGPVVGGRPDGCWEWFRLDDTMMRWGSFDKGPSRVEWTTHDASGAVYRVTTKH